MEIQQYSLYLKDELELSAKLIWQGISTINEIDKFDLSSVFPNNSKSQVISEIEPYNNQDKIFSFLYYLSVGIERYQKVILKIEQLPNEDYDPRRDKLFHGHNLESLNEELIRISKSEELSELKSIKLLENIQYKKMDKPEKRFLQLLSNFDGLRYVNFSSKNKPTEYYFSFITFIKKFSLNGDISDQSGVLDNLGKIIGKILTYYYTILDRLCQKKNIYLTEFNIQKESYFVFQSYIIKDYSLQNWYERQILSKSEFLYFLEYNASLKCGKINEEIFKVEPIDFRNKSLFAYDLTQYMQFFLKNTSNFNLIYGVDTYYDESGISMDKDSHQTSIFNNDGTINRRNFIMSFYNKSN